MLDKEIKNLIDHIATLAKFKVEADGKIRTKETYSHCPLYILYKEVEENRASTFTSTAVKRGFLSDQHKGWLVIAAADNQPYPKQLGLDKDVPFVPEIREYMIKKLVHGNK